MNGLATMRFTGERALWVLLVAEIVCFQALGRYSWGVIVMVAIAGLFFVVDLVQNNFVIDLKIGVFHKLILAFSLFCLLSAVWAIDSQRALSRGITLLELLVFVSVFYAHYARTKDVDAMLRALLWAGYILSIYTIYMVGLSGLFMGLESGRRLDTDYANLNSIGISAALAMLVSIYYALNEKIRFNFILNIPCLIVVAASGSRKALLALVVGILLIALFSLPKKKFTTAALYGLLFFTCFLLVLSFVQSIGLLNVSMARMDGFFALFDDTSAVDASTLERQMMIQVGIAQFLQTPLLGIGIDNSFYLVGTYLHNNYVELLCDVGIVGFVLFYSIYAYLFCKLLKKRNNEQQSLTLLVGVLLLIVLFMDVALVSYFSKVTYIYLMIAFVLVDEKLPESNHCSLSCAER